MKKILFSLFALTFAVYAQESATNTVQETVKVKMTGDRVSLRAAPETNAVLLGRAMLGDELTLRDNSNPDWVGVQPPDSVDLWVNSEFVISNTVVPELLNIRSGPSLSHGTVGTAHKGDILTVRSKIAQWLKIAPTSNTVIWVSRKYTAVPGNAFAGPDAVPAAVQETQTVVQAFSEPTVADVLIAASASSATNMPNKLKIDPAKPQGVTGTYYGILQPSDNMLYKLVDDHFTDIIVCHVYGNKPQMLTFTGMKIEITGKAYWVEGKDLPVVIPARIRLMPTVTNG
ncbi:MAG TPA: SH3 domain-containing protein [Pontiellaceae bacterium]|nr:SH3 domain-containing protein [Pontiellaceae bacterium]